MTTLALIFVHMPMPFQVLLKSKSFAFGSGYYASIEMCMFSPIVFSLFHVDHFTLVSRPSGPIDSVCLTYASTQQFK